MKAQYRDGELKKAIVRQAKKNRRRDCWLCPRRALGRIQGNAAAFLSPQCISVCRNGDCGGYPHSRSVGFNHTLLTKAYGPRVRPVSILMDAGIEPDAVQEKNLCIH